MIKYAFSAKKSAQAAGLLLKKHGGEMGNYVFIKMLYLSDREAFERWGEPITGDDAVSMEHGPVLSKIYDLTKGGGGLNRKEWEPFITDADEAHRVSLIQDPGDDELSPAEINILTRIHEKFKNFSWKQMKDYCHDFPEYDQTVGKSSRPIKTEKILNAVGKTEDDIRQKEIELREFAMVTQLFGSR